MYLNRSLEKILMEASASFPVVLVTGPRQVGKTTLMEKCTSEERRIVSLDHPAVRARAKADPELFFQAYPPPLLIDEIQYVPELFPFIKILADRERKPGMFWLTGSQQFSMMQNVSESLAGRVAILNLLGLSHSEIRQQPERGTFTDSLLSLPVSNPNTAIELRGLYDAILRGSFPALYDKPRMKTDLFYASYVKTYLERDIRMDISQESTFLKFLGVAAARTAQLVNYADMARDLDVSPNTVKSWISLLESSRIIYLLRPFHTNLTKRTVKTPKLYFTDTGLCAHLAGWTSSKTLEIGAMSGAILETYVVMEILKSYWNHGIEAPIYFYRDKDKNEIDLIIEANGLLHPVEIKKTAAPSMKDIRHFRILDDPQIKRGVGAVICLSTERMPLTRNVNVMNIGDI